MERRSWRRLLRGGPGSREGGFGEAPGEFTKGNRLDILHDGREAYPAMLSAVAQARSTVHLETYILRADATGWAFAKALADKARSAVQVRLIFDSIGSWGLPPKYVQFLRNHGVSVLEYHPIAPWRRRWAWSRRDHRKILVVDGSVGFTGGLNIADDYADPAQGGGGWRDIHVRIEGPAASELDRLFRANWFRESGRWFALQEGPAWNGGSSAVRVAANLEFLHRHRIRKAYLHALRRARRKVVIANAYFVPDRGIRRALYAAAARGAEVKVLVQGVSDVPAVTYAGRRLFEEHLRRGVRLFEWRGPVLHAKAVAVDGSWSAVGSYNMDHRSWLHNLEVNLHALDRTFGEELEASLERDIASSRELRLDEWMLRPLSDRALERVFHLLRYWL